MDKIIKILARVSPVLVSIALFFGVGYAPEPFIFERTAIADGEFWRLVTCHFIHCDFEHLVLNLLGLSMLILVFDCLSVKKIWLTLSAGIMVVDAWVWFGMADISCYCGLSGIENSLLAAGLGTMWKNRRSGVVAVAGGVAISKIIYEISTQTALFSSVSWQAVPEAHAAGFAAGIVLIAFVFRIKTPQFIGCNPSVTLQSKR